MIFSPLESTISSSLETQENRSLGLEGCFVRDVEAVGSGGTACSFLGVAEDEFKEEPFKNSILFSQ